jgi:predicted HicB family RNase H-like nuclease
LGYGRKPHKPYGLAPRRVHAARSLHARKVDERLKAPIAKTPEQWKAQSNRFDLPDIDTPKASGRSQEPKHEDEPTAIAFEPSANQHGRALIKIKPKVWQEAKIEAIKESKTVSELVEEALQKWINLVLHNYQN